MVPGQLVNVSMPSQVEYACGEGVSGESFTIHDMFVHKHMLLVERLSTTFLIFLPGLHSYQFSDPGPSDYFRELAGLMTAN